MIINVFGGDNIVVAKCQLGRSLGGLFFEFSQAFSLVFPSIFSRYPKHFHSLSQAFLEFSLPFPNLLGDDVSRRRCMLGRRTLQSSLYAPTKSYLKRRRKSSSPSKLGKIFPTISTAFPLHFFKNPYHL